MTKLNKAFSLLLALVMTVTCLGFSTTAYAADNSKCVTISFKGKENNAVLATVVNDINATRAAKGIAPVTLDSNLTNLENREQRTSLSTGIIMKIFPMVTRLQHVCPVMA